MTNQPKHPLPDEYAKVLTKIGRQESLKIARSMLFEYCEPNSNIDSGNLYFAAGEFRDATSDATKIITALLSALSASDAALRDLRCVSSEGNWVGSLVGKTLRANAEVIRRLGGA